MCYNIHNHVSGSEVLLGMFKYGATKLHLVALRIFNVMIPSLFLIQYLFQCSNTTKKNKTKQNKTKKTKTKQKQKK